MKNFFTRWAIATPLWLVYGTWAHQAFDQSLVSWVYWGVGLVCYLCFIIANSPWIKEREYDSRLCGCDQCRYRYARSA